jgi:hypothetical protein
LPDVLLDRRIHPKFHASLLREHRPNDDARFPSREPEKWYDFGEADATEQVVDEIVGHIKTSSKVKDLEFIVRWADGDTTFENYNTVKRLQALDQYFELQGVDKWQDLPKTQISGRPGAPTPGNQDIKPRVESKESKVHSDDVQKGKKIIWRISPDRIKVVQ